MIKSACTRASLIPYPVIAAAVGGNPEAVNRVVRHYSGYIAALSTRTSYDLDGFPRPQVDEDLRRRLETKLIILPIGATLLYLIPVVIAPAYLTGIHPLASVMGIYPHISEAAAAMVESLMQGVLFNTSPLVCVGSLLLIGATFAAASVVALKKQSY